MCAVPLGVAWRLVVRLISHPRADVRRAQMRPFASKGRRGSGQEYPGSANVVRERRELDGSRRGTPSP